MATKAGRKAARKFDKATYGLAAMLEGDNIHDVNTSLTVGTVARDANAVEANGTVTVSFDVVVQVNGIRTVVPVQWVDPMAYSLPASTRVAVVGCVTKKLFHAGTGNLGTATFVQAQHVEAL